MIYDRHDHDSREAPRPQAEQLDLRFPVPSNRARHAHSTHALSGPERDLEQRPRQRSRRHGAIQLPRGEYALLSAIGQFRAVTQTDGCRMLAQAQVNAPERKIAELAASGLIRSVLIRPRVATPRRQDTPGKTTVTLERARHRTTEGLQILTLTRAGVRHLRRDGYDEKALGRLRVGLTKEREVFHDAYIFRMVNMHRDALAHIGAHSFNVLTDSQLKASLFRTARDLEQHNHPQDQAKRLAAEATAIPIIDDKWVIPDARIEYLTVAGQRAHVDLELISESYSAAARHTKQAAGFVPYHLSNTGDLRSGRGGNHDDHDLMERIFSL